MINSEIYIQDLSSIAGLALPWGKIKNKSICITGATGLIGSVLVDLLMHRNERYNDNITVIALARNGDRAKKSFEKYFNEKNFIFIKQNIVEPILISHRVDYIIHSASNSDPLSYATDPVGTMTSNFLGIYNLLQYAKKYSVQRTLYISSGEIYGEIEDGEVFVEDSYGYINHFYPRACYPSSKRASETLCVAFLQQFGVDVVIARPSHIYGPTFTNSDSRAFAQFIRKALSKKDIVMKSDGQQVRSYCYVTDAVSALIFILFHGTSGQAYNVADKNSNVSILEMAELIAAIVHRKVRIEISDDLERKGYTNVATSIFDTTKLESLGWVARTSIKNGLEKTIGILSN